MLGFRHVPAGRTICQTSITNVDHCEEANTDMHALCKENGALKKLNKKH